MTSGNGIAIKTDFERFKLSLSSAKERMFIGTVQYIDFQKDLIPAVDALTPFVYKWKSYEHEKELRAIARMKDETGKDVKPNTAEDLHNLPKGIYIETDLDILIEKIYVAPTAPDWFLELIQSVLEVYQLNKQVIRSSLSGSPIY